MTKNSKKFMNVDCKIEILCYNIVKSNEKDVIENEKIDGKVVDVGGIVGDFDGDRQCDGKCGIAVYQENCVCRV